MGTRDSPVRPARATCWGTKQTVLSNNPDRIRRPRPVRLRAARAAHRGHTPLGAAPKSKVDRQAALVAVQGVEGAAAVRHRAGLVATPRLLDLDDVSTQVGQ